MIMILSDLPHVLKIERLLAVAKIKVVKRE